MEMLQQSLLHLRPRESDQPSYIDLVLLHYMRCWGTLCDNAPAAEGDWRDAWRVLEQLLGTGQVRAIGVSNAGVSDLEDVESFSVIGPPHVVQNWLDPLHQDAKAVDWCRQKQVVYQAFSSFGTQHKGKTSAVLGNTVVQSIASRTGSHPSQVVLAFVLSLGPHMVVLPRSSSPQHMRENLAGVDLQLSPDDRAALLRLDQSSSPTPVEDVHVVFRNRNVHDVDLYWENKLFAQFPAGSAVSSRSFVQHRWFIKQRNTQQTLFGWVVPSGVASWEAELTSAMIERGRDRDL